jgi:hypothetical protein
VDIDPGACEQGIFAQPPADGVVVLLRFFGLRWGQLERPPWPRGFRPTVPFARTGS